MNPNDENYLKVSSFHLPLKNSSLQSNISKDLSSYNKSFEDFVITPNPININQSIKSINKYVRIINYKNAPTKNNYSTISSPDRKNDNDRGIYTNTLFRGKFNINPIVKKTYYRTIKFRPKRCTNYPSLKLNLQGNKNFLRSGKINIELPLNKMKLENNIKSSDNILDLYKERIDENLINKEFNINNKKVINIKSEQIKFFSKISGDYTNFKKFLNFFTERNKPTINAYLTQLSNLIEIQRNILFIDNLNYNYFDYTNKKNEKEKYKKINVNKNNINNDNNTINNNNNLDNNNKKRVNIEEQKVHNLFNNKTMFNFLNINSEYNTILYKSFELIFNELKQLKEKNMELLKSNYANDILLINKNKELKEIEKYINSPQIKAFFDITKKKENIVKKMNNKFIKKENKYLLDLYQLNYEMKDLLLLLERNKDYYDKYKEIEQREKINNSENSYMKAHLTNELEKKEKQYKNEIELNNDLNADIIKLEENINELKNKNELMKIKEIEYETRIKRLYNIINERNENIRMLQEEFDYFYIKYNKEIKSHELTRLLLLEYKKNDRFKT